MIATRQWSAVHTQANKELLAASHLQRQGYVTFFPTISKRVKHARKVFDRKVSLFPSYIFVDLDLAHDRWTPINGTMGVRGVVMAGSKPARLPDGFIDRLNLELAGQKAPVAKQYEPLDPGVAIKVQDGPFKGLIGRFEAMTAAARVAVLLDLLGGQVRVDLDRGHISSRAA